MLENLNKLEEWYKSVKKDKNISLKEAKDLTKKMLIVESELEKKKIREELFFGTIYLLYKYLKNSYFIYQTSSEIDIDDIISASCEKWFSYCVEGKILEADYYSDLFLDFFRNLNAELFKTDFPFDFHKQFIIDACTRYILYRKDFVSFPFLEFQKLFPEIASGKVYYMFESIYTEIEKMHLLEKEKNVTLRKLKTLLPYLFYHYINAGYNPKDATNFICRQEVDDDFIKIENKILRNRVRQIFNESQGINKRKKHILEAYTGLNDNEPKSLSEIGAEYHFSKEYARVLKYEATRYFRNKKYQDSLELRYIYENYDFTR